MRTLVIAGLIAGGVAIFASDQGPGRSCMDSAGRSGAWLRTVSFAIVAGNGRQVRSAQERDDEPRVYEEVDNCLPHSPGE